MKNRYRVREIYTKIWVETERLKRGETERQRGKATKRQGGVEEKRAKDGETERRRGKEGQENNETDIIGRNRETGKKWKRKIRNGNTRLPRLPCFKVLSNSNLHFSPIYQWGNGIFFFGFECCMSRYKKGRNHWLMLGIIVKPSVEWKSERLYSRGLCFVELSRQWRLKEISKR